MKRKEYVRGLGFGIFITAAVFSFLKPETKSMTEEEIIQYAVSLGYIKAEENTDSNNSDYYLDDIKSQAMVTLTSTPNPTLNPTTEPTGTSTPTPKPTAEPTGTSTPTPKPTVAVQTPKTYTLVVTRGMTATKVANLLEDAGVIDSSEEFVSYLKQKKLTDYIMVGSFPIAYGASFAEIADQITWIP